MRLVVALLLATAASGAFAARGGHRGFHHHHAHVIVGSTFYFGPPLYPWPYAYPYYAPAYMPPPEPPVYVEKFAGAPGPDSPGEYYCPGQGAFYPQAQECPGGWQRVFRSPPAAAAR
ncbi:MAG TPA: hypothetical protein VFB08_17400 [Burkholderiales bacterium]|nr:hypothetical protein [Burkholderiales bacterium]